MKITITNLKNNQSVRFLDQREWDKEYKSYCTPYEIAEKFHDYQLRKDGYTGWNTLPSLNVITNKGIGQDGNTYLSEDYNDRDITWTCTWVGGLDTLYLAEVFHQDGNLLRVDWESDGRHYQVDGYKNGTYDNGMFDMTVAPFFKVIGNDETLKFVIPKYTGDTAFLPLLMPEVFISSKTTHTWVSEPIEVGIGVNCKIIITGLFNDIRITNSLNNQWFYIDSKEKITELIIDSINEEVQVNGNRVTNELYKGTLITFATGVNNLVFDIEKRLGPVNVEVIYDNLVGSVG